MAPVSCKALAMAMLKTHAPARRLAAKSKPGRAWLAPLLCALAALAWSGNHIVARMAVGHIPPWTLNTVRWAIVAVVVCLFSPGAILRDWHKLTAHAGIVAFLGLSGSALFGGLQFVAAEQASALTMGVMNSVAPAFIILAGVVFFRDRLSGWQLFGLAISLAGVLAIVTQLDPERLADLTFNPGDLLLVGNMALWGVYSACLRLRPETSDASFLFAAALVAAIACAPLAAYEIATRPEIVIDDIALLAIGYSSFFAGILSYLCWTAGIRLIGSARASPFLHLVPIYASVLATTLLGEAIGLHHPVGLVLILTGVTLATRTRRSD